MFLTPEQKALNKLAAAAFIDGLPIEYCRNGEWVDTPSSSGLDHLPHRPKPLPAWTLPEPPKGREWHRLDGWTLEMLPPGWRPCLSGEAPAIGDEYRPAGATVFCPVESRQCWGRLDAFNNPFRTRRPLPAGPVTRVWNKPPYVPANCWIRNIEQALAGECLEALVVAVSDKCLTFFTNEVRHINWDSASLLLMEYSADRIEWKKFEVVE